MTNFKIQNHQQQVKSLSPSIKWAVGLSSEFVLFPHLFVMTLTYCNLPDNPRYAPISGFCLILYLKSTLFKVRPQFQRFQRIKKCVFLQGCYCTYSMVHEDKRKKLRFVSNEINYYFIEYNPPVFEILDCKDCCIVILI